MTVSPYQTEKTCTDRHRRLWGGVATLVVLAVGSIGWSMTTANHANTAIEVHKAADEEAMQALQQRFDDHASSMQRSIDEIKTDIRALRNGE